jgi:IS605 OrfB family transposase
MSPTLIVAGAKASLGCPVEVHQPKSLNILKKDREVIAVRVADEFAAKAAISNQTAPVQPAPKFGTKDLFSLFNNKPVCSVDSGINTAATCSIVKADGTVIARKFLKCGRHNDQRDKLSAQIREKAAQTSLKNTPIKKGFCSSLYRRIAGINKQAAREIGRAIIAFAMEHGAATVVFEHLKKWRPKAPKKSMRHRFHRFLHRAIVKCVEHQAKEQGMRMAFVPPRGTSAWAYDGSGLVKRDARNYSLCEFTTGKQYNADVNAANNIAARFIMRALCDVGLVPSDRPAAEPGTSSSSAPGMPVCLSDVWAFAASLKQGGAHAPLCLS